MIGRLIRSKIAGLADRALLRPQRENATWYFTEKRGTGRPQTLLKPGEDCQKPDFATDGCMEICMGRAHRRSERRGVRETRGGSDAVAARRPRDGGGFGCCGAAKRADPSQKETRSSPVGERSTLFIGVRSVADVSRETPIRGRSNDPAPAAQAPREQASRADGRPAPSVRSWKRNRACRCEWTCTPDG